jgi:hypothetical protein
MPGRTDRRAAPGTRAFRAAVWRRVLAQCDAPRPQQRASRGAESMDTTDGLAGFLMRQVDYFFDVRGSDPDADEARLVAVMVAALRAIERSGDAPGADRAVGMAGRVAPAAYVVEAKDAARQGQGTMETDTRQAEERQRPPLRRPSPDQVDAAVQRAQERLAKRAQADRLKLRRPEPDAGFAVVSI